MTNNPITDVQNVHAQSVVNAGIIPLAVQAGLTDLIKTLAPFALGHLDLLFKVRDILRVSMQAVIDPLSGATFHPALNRAVFEEILFRLNPGEIYLALKLDVIEALVAYIDTEIGSPVVSLRALPKTVALPGPEHLEVIRRSPALVEVIFSAPLDGWHFEIFINATRSYVGSQEPDPADGYIHVNLPVPQAVGSDTYSYRVLYAHVVDFVQSNFCQPVYLP